MNLSSFGRRFFSFSKVISSQFSGYFGLFLFYLSSECFELFECFEYSGNFGHLLLFEQFGRFE